MEILHLSGTTKYRQCQLVVTEDTFIVTGDYYYLVDKEFKKVNGKQDTVFIKDYMGLGTLRKRSPKKMFLFIGLALVLEIVSVIADKLSDLFFMFDTGWTDYFVNTAAVICLLVGLAYLFSKKKVHEISFRTRRICVDEKMFSNAEMRKLDKVLLDLR